MFEAKDLTIKKNNNTLIEAISFKIEQKGILGVLCQSSSITDVLADVLCGVISADSGEILINGLQMSRNELALKRKVRLASHSFVAPSHMTVYEYLDFVGNALKLDNEKKYKQIKEALELTALDSVKNREISRLNISMHNVLTIAAAILGNPEILVLNDPFGGIEGEAFEDMYALVSMLGQIKTVILLTHNTDAVKRLCDDVVIISGGKIVLSGKIEDIEKKINSTCELHITIRGDVQTAMATVSALSEVLNVKLMSSEANEVHTVSVEHYQDSRITEKIFDALSDKNIPMLSVKPIILTLNDVYYSLTAQDTNIDNVNEDISKKGKLFARRRDA